jgi:hypothetical protein
MKKKKINKYFKKNILIIIPIIISIIDLIILGISLYLSFYQQKESKLPNIILESVENIILINSSNKEHYLVTYYNLDINTDMKIVNIGSGIAKNLKFTWIDENKATFQSLIEQLDKNKEIEFEENNSILSWKAPYAAGGVNIITKRYSKNIDYLLSETDKESTQILNVPYEYMIYMEMICYLSVKHGYDIKKIISNINLYLEMQYKDIENNEYQKTIPINVIVLENQLKNYTEYTLTFIPET